ERVAALRRNSREIVDAARANRRAISRTPSPWARQSAPCSRSVNARYRPDSGGAEGMRCDAAMPPASRNHRAPTAGDTPALIAAASLEGPIAIAAQNRRCSSGRRPEGRPGERSFARPDRSERLLRVVIATPFGGVLRRPVELSQHPVHVHARLAPAGSASPSHEFPTLGAQRKDRRGEWPVLGLNLEGGVDAAVVLFV